MRAFTKLLLLLVTAMFGGITVTIFKLEVTNLLNIGSINLGSNEDQIKAIITAFDDKMEQYIKELQAKEVDKNNFKPAETIPENKDKKKAAAIVYERAPKKAIENYNNAKKLDPNSTDIPNVSDILRDSDAKLNRLYNIVISSQNGRFVP